MSGLANENGRAREHGASAGLLEKAVEFDIDVNENAVPPVVETPSKHAPSSLDAHAAAGHELIPIAGKTPVAKGWLSSPALSLEAAKARMAAGKNVGVRLRDTDLVIDVDPRHFGDDDDPLARLVIDFGLPDAPFVLTGGGGRHLYFRKPAGVEVAGKLAAYAGIDFKSKGGQVVAAGSIHPDTARSYVLDDDVLRIELAEAPEASTALLDAITKRSATEASGGGGSINEERLAEWLGHVDVTRYKDQHDWQEMMMSCHHATKGVGVDVFINWSTSDPDYADHGDIIRRRWKSLKGKPKAITVRTLIAALPKEMRREATELLGRAAPEDDFDDDLDDAPARRIPYGMNGSSWPTPCSSSGARTAGSTAPTSGRRSMPVSIPMATFSTPSGGIASRSGGSSG